MNIGDNAKEQLRSVISRIEKLSEEKDQVAEDIRDVYSEAKSNGFDVKALRTIVRMRKQDKEKREAHEAIVETYKHALGMLADLPLGQAAMSRKIKELADEGKQLADKMFGKA